MVSQINNIYDERQEINFKKLETHILFDLARTISNKNRYFNMLMVCGLTCTLDSLEIPYTLNLIGDSDLKIRLKSIDEPHSELVLQKLCDCVFIKRNITQLSSCLKYFIINYPPKDENTNSVYYIFSNGFDDELIKIKACQHKIFIKPKISFNFVFMKSKVLNKETNIENKNYLESVWNKFAEEANDSGSIVTVNSVEFEDIEKLDNLIENFSKVLLREINIEDKETSHKYKSLFNIDCSKNLTLEYIDSIRNLLSEKK